MIRIRRDFSFANRLLYFDAHCFSWAVSRQKLIVSRGIATQTIFPAVSTLFSSLWRRKRIDFLLNHSQDLGSNLFPPSKKINDSGSRIGGRYFQIFHERFVSILDYLENDYPTEN